MNIAQIKSLQKAHGYEETQNRINSGSIWKFEGSIGRQAMELLKAGVCMLPKKVTHDAYGNEIPSRDLLRKGTKGTFQNCAAFWQKVQSGECAYFKPLKQKNYDRRPIHNDS